jgi:hypothetical protein
MAVHVATGGGNLPSEVVDARGAAVLYVPISNGANGYSWGAQSGGGGGSSVDDINIPVASATGILAPDLSTGRVIVGTQTGDITGWAPTNVPASTQTCSVLLFLTQDTTGGHGINLGSSVTWLAEDGSGNPPTFDTAAGGFNIIPLFTKDGGTTWIGETPLTLAQLQAMFVPFGTDLSSNTPGTVSSVLGGLTPVTRSSVPGVTFAATYALALTTSDTTITGTLTANTAITLTGLAAGTRCRFWFKQDATGGRVPSINGTAVNFSPGVLAATTGVAKIDCDYDGANLWVGSA